VEVGGVAYCATTRPLTTIGPGEQGGLLGLIRGRRRLGSPPLSTVARGGDVR
jgi:hypothetical protein